MSGRALRVVGSGRAEPGPDEPGWLGWLGARLDPAWRPGEWDGQALLFTGDLASPRTAAWPCRTPGCPTGTRRPSGRCDGCRRARSAAGIGWPEFDAAPPTRATRPLCPGSCSVPGCEGDLHSGGLCFRHERRWNTDRTRTARGVHRPVPPAGPAPGCRVAGCDRESIGARQLCRFHDNRLQAPTPHRRTVGRAARRLGGRGSGLGSGCTSSPWPGCPNGCASSCSTGCNSAIRRHHRWIPPRCGSCSAASATPGRCAMLTHKWSASPAGRSTTPRPGGCSATCAGIWTGPGHSTRARIRSPATCGRWRCSTCPSTPPAAGQPPRAWSTSASSNNPGCARSSRTGPGPPGLTCNGCGRRCAPVRPPPTP